MTASCAASCVFILMITAEFIYAREAGALSAAVPVTFDNHAVRIPVASVSDGNLHRFVVDDQGVHVRFIVILKADHSFAVAYDACQICGTQGYLPKRPRSDLQKLRVGYCDRDHRNIRRLQSDTA